MRTPSSGRPPDTAPPDTAPPDTAPPDTAPPDTAPPGTAPPGTAPPDTAPPGTAPPGTPDRSYVDPELARLYNALNPWGPGDDFYLDLVMSARSVLDVGCGTGTLLHAARRTGHTGRLCGLDPAAAMLDQARTRPDVEWVLGTAASARWDREFDLVVMTGHAFQELVEDDVLRDSLAAIRSALVEGGRFAFETGNPLVRPWETWTPDRTYEVTGPGGEVVTLTHEVRRPVTGGVVHLTGTYTSPAWDRPQVDAGRMRFLDVDGLSAFLSGAGLVVDERFGDWDRTPLTAASPEIISVTRRPAHP